MVEEEIDKLNTGFSPAAEKIGSVELANFSKDGKTAYARYNELIAEAGLEDALRELIKSDRYINATESFGTDDVNYKGSKIMLMDKLIGKYRKIHLPGHYDFRPLNKFQNLEINYFNTGNLGFNVFTLYDAKIGLCLCNDRRWPETFRTLALLGAEIILLGYNTPLECPDFSDINQFVSMHNLLCLQAGAYQNSVWIVSAAKAGLEEGVKQLGESTIISPTGEVKVMSKTLEDELIVHECDLGIGDKYRSEIFDFENRRKPDNYKIY